MALPNIGQFNNNRKELLKIKTANDETILLSKNEIKTILITYITDELELMATDISGETIKKLEEKISYKINEFEIALVNHIDDKFNKITETIISKSVNRIIEEEVNRRLDIKLKKIKDSL